MTLQEEIADLERCINDLQRKLEGQAVIEQPPKEMSPWSMLAIGCVFGIVSLLL